jgi:two-component system LytT family response regulator
VNEAGLRVLVADDEAPARGKLKRFLEAAAGIEVVYEAGSGTRALDVIRESAPDLVFLDVQMPGLDGFAVLEALPAGAMPHVVFVTAYDAYALKAFEVHAVDYLLKPFDAERFERALARARERVAARRGSEERDWLRRLVSELVDRKPSHEEHLLVEAASRSVLLATAAIDRIEADRNYASVCSSGRVYTLRATMDELEGRLDPSRFVRINRSTIVNVERIVDLVPEGHGDAVVRLGDGTRLRLSRRYRDRLERFRPSSPRR